MNPDRVSDQPSYTLSWMAAHELSAASPINSSDLSSHCKVKNAGWEEQGSGEAMVSPRFPTNEPKNVQTRLRASFDSDKDIAIFELSKKLYEASQVIEQQESVINKLEVSSSHKSSLQKLSLASDSLERKAKALEQEKHQLSRQNEQLLDKLKAIEQNVRQYEHVISKLKEQRLKEQRLDEDKNVLLTSVKKENTKLKAYIDKLKQVLQRKDQELVKANKQKRLFEVKISDLNKLMSETKPRVHSARQRPQSVALTDRPSSHLRERGTNKLKDLLGVNDSNEVLSTVKTLLKNYSTEHRFVSKVTQLVEQCTGFSSLHTAWKWIRKIVEEYSHMKKGAPGVINSLKLALKVEQLEAVPQAVEQLLEDYRELLELLARIKRIFGFPDNFSVQEMARQLTKTRL